MNRLMCMGIGTGLVLATAAWAPAAEFTLRLVKVDQSQAKPLYPVYNVGDLSEGKTLAEAVARDRAARLEAARQELEAAGEVASPIALELKMLEARGLLAVLAEVPVSAEEGTAAPVRIVLGDPAAPDFAGEGTLGFDKVDGKYSVSVRFPEGQLPGFREAVAAEAQLPPGATEAIAEARQVALIQSSSGVPLLRDIPLLGGAFQRDHSEEVRLQYLLFLSASGE